MDVRDLTVIENKTKVDEKVEVKPIHHTNPIAKKFVKFQKENLAKFGVKDLFKNVPD